MRLVSVVVRPHEVADVVARLEEVGVQGLTASEVLLPGVRREVHRGHASAADEAVVRLDCAVDDFETGRVVDTLAATAALGPAWVSPLDTLVRVRTGERDEDAL